MTSMDKVLNIAHKTVTTSLIIFTGVAAYDVARGYNSLIQRAKERRAAAELQTSEHEGTKIN